jgi:flagellar FliJ protein
MAKRFPLQPLHDLASDRLEAAERRLAQIKQRLQGEEQKLQQLRDFQDEYRRRLGLAVASGMDMTRVRDFHAFLSKIDTAIRQQKIEIARSQTEWEEGQRLWLEERRKLKTYDVLRARHVRAEQRREDQLEQKDLDEHARKIASPGPQPESPDRGKG